MAMSVPFPHASLSYFLPLKKCKCKWRQETCGELKVETHYIYTTKNKQRKLTGFFVASLNWFLAPVFTTQRRVVRTGATASKASGVSSTEEKGVFDFVLGVLAKQEQIYETDPILKKVEEKNLGGTKSRSRAVAAPPEKKKGGFDFGGLFSKK